MPRIINQTEGWFSGWPTETGWCWFYGDRFVGCQSGPRLKCLEITKQSLGPYGVVHDVFFQYRRESVRGLWLKIEPPELPLQVLATERTT